MVKGGSSPRVSRPSVPKSPPIRTSLPKPTAPKTKAVMNLGSRTRPQQRMPQQKKITTPRKLPVSNYLRQKAVKSAWRQEQTLVKAGGGTRDWTKRQREQIVRAGKLKHYEGHHLRSVNGHTKKWAGDPRNIKLVTRREHLREHRGNFRNETTGKLIDRQKLLRMQKNRATPRQTKQ